MEFISHSQWPENTFFLQLIKSKILASQSQRFVTVQAHFEDPDLALGFGHHKVP